MINVSECLQTDVLIIGCGIAGSIAALQLADEHIPVTVITREYEPEESNTFYAQGGIIFRGQEDTSALLRKDILNAGAGYCNPAAVDVLIESGPGLVKELLIEKYGVGFDREKSKELSIVREGGHSIPRIIHSADVTGKLIEQTLINRLKTHPGITLLTSHTAIDLLTPAHHSTNRLSIYEPHSCVGAYILDRSQNRVIRCLSKMVIMASGGLGQIYLRTTNPAGARGDGIAMAYRAGARVINNEFIQFHPTAFFRRNTPLFLITESIRGAGAKLVHANGEPFMQRYDEQWKDLAPRDVVARSIHEEMLLKDVPNVYLDIAGYIPESKIRSEFPGICLNCLKYGIDITKELVPVVPAAHYNCGGIWVDINGQTTVNHLYAIGEVSCTGVHGANRLASTSLLEGLVWAYRTARHISSRSITSQPHPSPSEIPPWHEDSLEIPDPALISQDLSYIKNIMWNYVGLARTTNRLERALRELRNLETEIEIFYRMSMVTDSLIGLRNGVRTSIIVALAAWENKNSIGCHFRQD